LSNANIMLEIVLIPRITKIVVRFKSCGFSLSVTFSGSFLTLGSLVPPNVEGIKKVLVGGNPPTIILPQRCGFVYVKLSMASHFGIEDQEDSPEGKMGYQPLHSDKTQYCAVSPEGEVMMGGKDNIQWWSRTRSPLATFKA
jgi:hypothetical protein